MNLSKIAIVLMSTLAFACGSANESDGDQDVTAEQELHSAAVVSIGNGSITQASAKDVLRRTPGQTVLFRNVTSSSQRLVLSKSNVIRGNADYAQAEKIDVPTGGSVRLGGNAHPLAAGATFVGFDSPTLKLGWRDFARFTVYVGRATTAQCDVTTAAIGTDACPAWGIDADFCTCTAALPGGG